MIIESLQNEKIKWLTRVVSDNRYRKKSGVFVVEGQQENEMAKDSVYEVQEYFICKDFFDHQEPSGKINWVSPKVYEKIAYRGTTEGIIGIYKTVETEFSTYQPADNATIIVLEGIEKPGNLGAILRSCEAFGIDALVITDSKTDFFNPNVIRSSVGCLFKMKIFECSNAECLETLNKSGFQILTTIMKDNFGLINKRNFKQRTAVIFGTEHSGLSDFWQEKGENTLIPMSGSIDSLNLSNAVAIACYESLRQKGE